MQLLNYIIRKTTLSARILYGLGLGIFTGLFIGENADVLQPLSDIYIRLMQMTVLPYLITALIIALGQLQVGQAKRLAVRIGILLLVVWLAVILVIFVTPLAFPEFESAAFYSDALIAEPHRYSFAELYFTSNIFESLANNIVPPVVLFSCLVGIGVMQLEDKDKLLVPLRVWNTAVVRVTKMVMELTPIGVFAIGAVAAGTIDPETLTRLEVYFISFAVAALLLTVLILPLLVTAVTPFSYREVAGIARGALLTAFVANNAFIVLPLLIERSKELLREHDLLDDTTDSATEIIIPILFNFPNAGKLMTLLFIPFAAWLSGAPLALGDYSTLFGAGIPSYFAKASVALPFLLDLFELPQDLFQLYLPTTIITGKFDSMVTAANLLVFGLLGAGAMGGFLVFDRARLMIAAFIILGAVLLVALGLRFGLTIAVDTSYHLDEAVSSMHNVTRDVATVVHRKYVPLENVPDVADRLQLIRSRGSLRIGYDPNNLPFSFYNADQELVGFDVELAEQLAAALEVTAEFVPIDWSELPALLRDGQIDVMPGMWYRPFWFDKLQLTEPYFIGTIGFAVRDDRRKEFSRVESLRTSRGLKIGVPLDRTQLATSIDRYFDNADVELVTIEFWQPYFEGEHPEIDAFLMPAEHAAGWTLMHPEYAVVVPQPDAVKVPTAFGVAKSSDELIEFINQWIRFADNAGIIERNFNYWVNGEGATSSEPRWSIMRNVLGWDIGR
ncbi:MAG: cation:dicarboxylate symporter family transporter [Gammaproteobacteria bacterium]